MTATYPANATEPVPSWILGNSGTQGVTDDEGSGCAGNHEDCHGAGAGDRTSVASCGSACSSSSLATVELRGLSERPPPRPVARARHSIGRARPLAPAEQEQDDRGGS